MRKRKIISSILAMSCLLGASVGNVFAEGRTVELSNDGKTAKTFAYRNIQSKYTIKIPGMIELPDFSETKGNLINIEAGDFNLAMEGHVDVRLDYINATTQNNYLDTESSSVIIKYRKKAIETVAEESANEETKYLAPIRLTDEKDGGNIEVGQKEEGKLKNKDVVASFGNDKKNSISKRLYVYSIHEKDENGKLVAKSSDKDLKAGVYFGVVNFSSKYVKNNHESGSGTKSTSSSDTDSDAGSTNT